jgi:molybdate transport system ATP-binding protein
VADVDAPAPELRLDLHLAHPGFLLAARLALPLRGITVVFGPSGCGKSSLLRAIAGLEPSATGTLQFGGETWLGAGLRRPVPAHERGAGLVFQDTRLFAHLGVQGNLRYAEQRARQVASPAIRFDAVVQALDLAPLLARRTQALSGGERQRVAIARTLLARPRLLLMDEPLAALDARRKAEILPLLQQLPAVFGVPVLYVTHDLDELARLAQQVVLMAGGRVTASGAAEAVLADLDTPGLDPFETGVLLRARLRRPLPEWQLAELDLQGQTLLVPLQPLAAAPPGSLHRLRVRARDVALSTQPPQGLSIRNVLQVRLLSLRSRPELPEAEALLALPDGQPLRARITRQAAAELGLHEGQALYALVKSVALSGAASADNAPLTPA